MKKCETSSYEEIPNHIKNRNKLVSVHIHTFGRGHLKNLLSRLDVVLEIRVLATKSQEHFL